MIPRFAVLAQRIRQELDDLELLIHRAEHYMTSARTAPDPEVACATRFRPERVAALAERVRSVDHLARTDMLKFAAFLDRLAATGAPGAQSAEGGTP